MAQKRLIVLAEITGLVKYAREIDFILQKRDF
jgi:hypothetical protein